MSSGLVTGDAQEKCQPQRITQWLDASSYALAESFFATLKLEAVQGWVFATRFEARMVIFDYSEVFYNRQRLRSSNNYVAPITMVA